MTADSADQALLVRYLLDASSDEEKVRVEQEFFASDEAFARLCEIEDDLLTKYEQGRLSAEERTQVESAYQRSPRRDRRLFHAALQQVVSTLPRVPGRAVSDEGRPAAWRRWLTLEPLAVRWTLAAAAALLVIAVSGLAWQARGLRADLDVARKDREAFQRATEAALQRTAELERRASQLIIPAPTTQPSSPAPAPAANPPLVVAFSLSPELTRGAVEPTRLLVPRAAGAVRFQLDLETAAEYTDFRVELRSAAGDLAWGPEARRPQTTRAGRVLTLTIPADLVADGEYEVILRGSVKNGPFEDAAHYYFGVTRR
jgi:hypothetical protein